MTDAHLALVQNHHNAHSLAHARKAIDDVAIWAFLALDTQDFGKISTYVSGYRLYLMRSNTRCGSVLYEDAKRDWKVWRDWFLQHHGMGDFENLWRLFRVVDRWLDRFTYMEKCYLVQYMLRSFA